MNPVGGAELIKIFHLPEIVEAVSIMALLVLYCRLVDDAGSNPAGLIILESIEIHKKIDVNLNLRFAFQMNYVCSPI